MRIFLFTLLLFYGSTGIAQVVSRVVIEGEIIAPQGDDLEGIKVMNTTTKVGAVTDEKGSFIIPVGLNDRLEVKAIQFQKFTVTITKSILTQKQLHVFVNESVNQLEEVLVTPYDLSGNISVDVNRIPLANRLMLLPNESAAKINESRHAFSADEQSHLDNLAMGGRRIMGELNFVSLFKVLWNSTHVGHDKTVDQEAIDIAVRKIYNDQFFKDHMALEIEQIDGFINFAEANGLDGSYLTDGKELDLISFLLNQSEAYPR